MSCRSANERIRLSRVRRQRSSRRHAGNGTLPLIHNRSWSGKKDLGSSSLASRIAATIDATVVAIAARRKERMTCQKCVNSSITVRLYDFTDANSCNIRIRRTAIRVCRPGTFTIKDDAVIPGQTHCSGAIYVSSFHEKIVGNWKSYREGPTVKKKEIGSRSRVLEAGENDSEVDIVALHSPAVRFQCLNT